MTARPPRTITPTCVWVQRVGCPKHILRMLADGTVVVDGQHGRIRLRLEFNPKPLPPDVEKASDSE